MTEDRVEPFRSAFERYFRDYPDFAELRAGESFLQSRDKAELLDFTGSISLSGDYRGGIYISAERPLLSRTMTVTTGIEPDDDGDLEDMVGELANTVVGNARKTFGPGLNLSVPMVISGERVSMLMQKLESPIVVIPYTLAGARAHLGIAMEPAAPR
jgi:chemotaxis protein CheX